MTRLALAALLLLLPPARAAEPWADRALPVSDGLVLWLDASRQPAARKADNAAPLAHNAPLNALYDASGHGLHLVQPRAAFQPRYVAAGRHAAVRFDGKAAALGASNLRRKLGSFTLFVVAVPRSNAGGFRGLLAANELGRNDYTTGFTLDLNFPATARLSNVNVEGKGFGGAANLMRGEVPFGESRTFEVVSTTEVQGVRLLVDGKPLGTRDRAAGALKLDELTLGARYYSNTAAPAHVQGHFDGDIAEVLLFDRELSTAERGKVRAYLSAKHKGLVEALAPAGDGVPLRTVANPPAVQFLVPGFTARELPVTLPNLNNVKYRPDGKLFALAYNGDIYLLSDTDGDGIEDKADLWWENKRRLRGPIGLALTPPGYKHGDGVFVPSKGKLSLIVDTKQAGKADREIVVATGWKEIPQNVDAIGVAVGKGGEIYLGLGTANYADAYLMKDGKSRYDLTSERGTVLEISPDFKTRKIYCTGTRFPVAMAFNRRGDLFATDQEGATWLPNGNPFDELLHLQRGRHYGFPPRHPKHLPNVIDEPSTFDYGPQHQSTCGLNFNEPVNGGPTFGPKFWAGDALVSGFSRGKLYRTQLAHTKAGYVARNHLIACLNMMTVDACVSPKGELVVAVHSGPPDWGTGPVGKGKLYKVAYAQRRAAQPVAAWAAGPREVRVAFDRAVTAEEVRGLEKSIRIEYGAHVRPGDRFEVHRPPYAVVQAQLGEPRRRLAVYSVRLEEGGTVLAISTAGHLGPFHHAITLPGFGRPAKPGAGELAQHPEVDIGYDLCGVEAKWVSADGKTTWSGWLPHPSPAVSRALLVGSAAHKPLWRALDGAGTLTLVTKLDLWQMLRPAVQPGSALDHTWPAESVSVAISSALGTVTVEGPNGKPEGPAKAVRETLTAKEGEPAFRAITWTKPAGAGSCDIVYSTTEDKRERPLPLHRFLLPGAPNRPEKMPAARRIAGGNWLRGQRVFHSDEAGCAKCHTLRGRGGQVGPDLSNLIHRDYDSVLRDIVSPSAALNPDHITYTAEMADGRVYTGILRDGGPGQVILLDASGGQTVLDRGKIESLTPSKTSLMPAGIDKVLSREQMEDLLTFLLTEPLAPAALERAGEPPPRSWAEVEAALKGVQLPKKPGKKLRILLAAGPKDHGPGEHDYPLWQRRWYSLLSLADEVSVEMTPAWPSDAQRKKADVIVFYSNNPGWSPARARELKDYLDAGGGVVYLHWAVEGQQHAAALAELIGLASNSRTTKYRHGALELTFPNAKSDITRGLGKLKFVDESYWDLVGDAKRLDVLATGVEAGRARPLMWARAQGKGRVFVSILGHYNWTFDDPLFRLVVLRGLCWTAGEPADRLSELITVGARVGR